jgi:hypothetical protein
MTTMAVIALRLYVVMAYAQVARLLTHALKTVKSLKIYTQVLTAAILTL